MNIERFQQYCSWIFYSDFLTKQIFHLHISPHPYSNVPNWDLTTIQLKNALDKYILPNQTVLEIGTGHLAILSTYIAKKKNIQIMATDINPYFIENAIRNARLNNVPIRFQQSDLFLRVDGKFDIVFFNPPYVPLDYILVHQKERYTNSIFDLVWNGGLDGCETLNNFLKSVENVVHEDSIILLGVNSIFVSLSQMKALIRHSDLVLISIECSKWNPSKVYVLKPYQ